MALTLRQHDLVRLREAIGRGGAWWLDEFFKLLPARHAAFLRGGGRPTLIVGNENELLHLRLQNAGAGVDEAQSVVAEDALAVIGTFLSQRDLDRRDVEIGLRLPEELLFSRELILPVEAKASIDAIAAQDLARKTPFKAVDIYSDHRVERGLEGGRLLVRQWITRRQYVERAVDELGLQLTELRFVRFGEQQAAPSIRLSSEAGRRNIWKTVLAGLCCSAIGLAVLLGFVEYDNQQAALGRLEMDIAAATRKAQMVRQTVDQLRERRDALVRLRLQRSSAPGLIDLWEETTRILPHHSWLTELRLVEGSGAREAQVIMSGFSSAAPSLISIVDGSPLFSDAALASAVAFDANEGRERFSLQARVRSSVDVRK
ncbi:MULTISPECIES: PilN domain-containing protein [unclassified Bradyrhizobium]|uniref:PilN domain-containing protein n=1 Tax=unclassified Bradyrhizobium TaxID=2631580 RepID=UPI0028E18754|nr:MULTISPECIES: PilN domain-containing protein [unclassified Bradyrhizobium]